jgi:hypothetical protein
MRPARAGRATPARLPFADEAALAAAWGRGAAGPHRLADGRVARVVFPGVPGSGAGPDFAGAIIDVAGDLLRGDVELHLRHSGWFSHGHDRDPAYRSVALHVVAVNDLPLASTPHGPGRSIPLLVLAPAPRGLPAAFVPPCVFARAAGLDVTATLRRMGERRLRIKANRAALLAADRPAGDVLLALLPEAVFGPANRAAARALAGRLRLAPLLEAATAAGPATEGSLALAAVLRGLAAGLAFPGRVRPGAAPGRRLDALARLIACWWPAGSAAGWPPALVPGVSWQAAAVDGLGRGAAIEVVANALIPAALATGAWSEPEALAAWAALPTPGTYGRLRPLERWLAGPGQQPFAAAASLQGGLLLQADYCEKGACGRCPLSPPG